MKQKVIEKTGEVVSLEKRAVRRFYEAVGLRRGRYHIAPLGNRAAKGNEPPRPRGRKYTFTDREAELEFCRWASVLNEEIVLETFLPCHPKAGQAARGNDTRIDGETLDEVKTIYEWGRELADLENVELPEGDPRIARIHNIMAMFIDCRLVWAGGPQWWHEL